MRTERAERGVIGIMAKIPRAGEMKANRVRYRLTRHHYVFVETLGLDARRYAERWRGPADREPGSPWPRNRGGFRER